MGAAEPTTGFVKKPTEDKEIPISQMVELTDGQRLLLPKAEGRRIVNYNG